MAVSPLTDPATINEANREAYRLAFSGRHPLEEKFAADRAEAEKQRGRAALAEWQAESAPRLVKARKSPTEPADGDAGRFLFDVGRLQRAAAGPPAPALMESEPGAWAPDCQGPGRFAVVESRRWAGEYRIRTEVDPGNLAPPEPPRGTRWTDMLTERGARKIAESCFYVAKMRGGYNTFLTLTLDESARERLARRIVEPVGTLADGMLVQAPEWEPAQDRRGSLGPIPTGESMAENTTVAGPWTCIDGESARPYNPVCVTWEWSIQREASRFFEAMGKMYRRGWSHQEARRKGNDTRSADGALYTPIRWETVRVPGSPETMYRVGHLDPDSGRPFTPLEDGPQTALRWEAEPLDYLWVAESPDRIDHETGEVTGENPHLHVMIRWRVPKRHFRAWAHRVECLWGQGMAHLEKIKEPEKAGAYVAKAAGYLSKAQGKDDQGTIRGNRYGISQRARAPDWTEEERYQLGVMGWLLAEAAEKWEEHHGEKVQRRERLKRQLEQADTRERRQKIGRMLEQVRGELEPLPRVSKYTAILKGDQQLERFMQWARRQGFEEEPGNGQWLAQWRANQWQRRHGNRLQAAAAEVANWLDMAEGGAVALDESDFNDWGLYADFGLVHLPGLPEAGQGQVFTGDAALSGL